MAGINLSQSLQEKQSLVRGNFFDKGFYVNIGLFLVVLATYGGTQWYLGSLEKKLVTIQSQVDERTAALEGPEVDKVADLRNRLDMIGTNLSSEPDPDRFLAELERSVVSGIQITGYSLLRTENKIVIKGKTDNLRFLAQQMLALKKVERFEKIHTDTVEYDTDGKIEFVVTINLLQSTEPAV